MLGPKFAWRVVFQDNSYTVITAKSHEKVMKMLAKSEWRDYTPREVYTVGKA